MRKTWITALLGALALTILGVTGVFAGPPEDRPIGPPDGVFLGYAQDRDGTPVVGYAFYHHRTGHTKGGGGEDETPTTVSCYSLIFPQGGGIAWKTTEDYVVNPSNGEGLDEATLLTQFAAGIEEWDSQVATDIFGSQGVGGNGADWTSPDGANEVAFAAISDTNVIAVTVVWYTRQGRRLIEWDMEFNTNFSWSTNGAGGTMDFQNIAVHEIGHAAGMGHAQAVAECADETMYPTAAFGETSKRDLNTGDVNGINDLY